MDMNYKMTDLKGIDQSLVAKLNSAGVETTNDMMKVWHDPDRRTKVEASSGLNEEQFKRMVSMARMARMEGVGPKYADLLVTAGVIGRKSLSKHTPEALVKHLAEVNASQNRTGPVPTLAEVGAWFADMKPLNAPPD
jgi:predicted flap endonuclease-1-like 5' DNA nuclease